MYLQCTIFVTDIKLIIMARQNKTFRMDPGVLHYAEQAAFIQHRSLNNLIELLLMQEVNRMKEVGYKFNEYIEPGGKMVGKGSDNILKQQFEKFTEKH